MTVVPVKVCAGVALEKFWMERVPEAAAVPPVAPVMEDGKFVLPSLTAAPIMRPVALKDGGATFNEVTPVLAV